MPRQTVLVDPRFPRRLRELRARSGLSLRALAAATLSSKSHVHEFETGAKLPRVDTAQRLDDALGARGELVALVAHLRPWEDDPAMRRRSLMGAAIGLAAGSPTFAEEPDGVGSLERATLRTARLRRLDSYLGGADTYPIYLAEVQTTTRALHATSSAPRRALLALLAEQAQMAGFSAFDAGWYPQAERLFRTSLVAAQDASDASLMANALTFLGYQSLALGESGVDYCAGSCDLVRSATPRVASLMFERRAWAHAIAGDAKATAEWLARAETAVRQRAEQVEPDWTAWVDPTEIQIMTGRCWSVLHRPVRAISALEAALRQVPDTSSRDKALYLSFLADAYLDANEVEHACDVTDTAMDLASDVRSQRPRQRIEAVVQRLEPHRGLPRVADVLGRFSQWRPPVRALPASTPDSGPGPLQLEQR